MTATMSAAKRNAAAAIRSVGHWPGSDREACGIDVHAPGGAKGLFRPLAWRRAGVSTFVDNSHGFGTFASPIRLGTTLPRIFFRYELGPIFSPFSGFIATGWLTSGRSGLGCG